MLSLTPTIILKYRDLFDLILNKKPSMQIMIYFFTNIADAIENENLNYLKKFPKIGDKVAKQMVLDLKGKLNTINTGLFAKEDLSDELFEVLIALGYKQADVKRVINHVDSNLSLENQVKEALKLMLK